MMPSGSVARVARQVSVPPTFDMAFVAKSAAPGFRYDRATAATPVRSVARTLIVTERGVRWQ